MPVLLRRLNILANMTIVVAGGFLLLGPQGPVGSRVASVMEGRRLRSELKSRWTELTGRIGENERSENPVLIEFSDYQCPFCRQEHLRTADRVASTPGVQRVFRHFPLPSHPAADGAALAAICGEQLGKFSDIHEVLMTTRDWQVDTNWVKVADQAGIDDLHGFEQCLASPETRKRLESDIALGRDLGVKGTPTYFSRSKMHYGVMDDRAFHDLLGLR